MSIWKPRLPSEMQPESPRTPVSARVKVETKKILMAAAKKEKLSLGLLIAGVLDDYAAFLKSEFQRGGDDRK